MAIKSILTSQQSLPKYADDAGTNSKIFEKILSLLGDSLTHVGCDIVRSGFSRRHAGSHLEIIIYAQELDVYWEQVIRLLNSFEIKPVYSPNPDIELPVQVIVDNFIVDIKFMFLLPESAQVQNIVSNIKRQQEFFEDLILHFSNQNENNNDQQICSTQKT